MKRERGVRITTVRVIFQLIVSMNISVARIVTTPVKSCVKPMSRPSANWSASAMTRLTVSPAGWISR